jgi:hypothetical protein
VLALNARLHDDAHHNGDQGTVADSCPVRLRTERPLPSPTAAETAG